MAARSPPPPPPPRLSGTRSSRVGRGAAVHAVGSEPSGLGGEGVVDRGDIPWPSGEGSGGQRGPGGSAPAQAPLLRAPPGSERLEGISVEEVMVARMQLLEEELSSLKEELALCQADKEFVWSLWKRLQVTNPDITQTVSLIVERLPLPIQSKDGQFAPHLACPVVLRRMLCGKDGPICRCSTYSVPEVTDLEYDHLINQQLSSMDQIIIVYVFSAKEKDNTIKEVNKVYREQNKARNMPCTQSRLDSFRFIKYNIISASKFTGSNYPLLVQRHNVVPGIFLMYIQGKLLFANFIFNGYSTSAKDLQKQIVKTRGDYHMGYFLPSDFRIRAQPTACFGNEDILL